MILATGYLTDVIGGMAAAFFVAGVAYRFLEADRPLIGHQRQEDCPIVNRA
jgi:hypothetical protein